VRDVRAGQLNMTSTLSLSIKGMRQFGRGVKATKLKKFKGSSLRAPTTFVDITLPTISIT
jgi:hypothetical protein